MYGQMNDPPSPRARVRLTGLTVAEHFQDAEAQDVLLFIDNIFRFTQVLPLNYQLTPSLCVEIINPWLSIRFLFIFFLFLFFPFLGHFGYG